MKVLHLISGGDTGGAKTHVFALLSKLKDMADVKIVCFMKGVFWDELQDIDVKSELIEQKSRFDLSVVDRLVEICSEGYEVIHCHGARANFIGTFLGKKVKIPMITTIHSDYLLDFDGFYRKLVYTSLNVWALKKFKYYIAVSSNFKEMLVSRGFRPNSIHTVYNGMDYSGEMSYVSKEEFAARIGIEYNPDLTYIGLIGRHDFVKGHDVFIKSIRKVTDRFPDVRFIIAGTGENRDNLVKLAADEGVTDKLIFAGFVKDIYSFINFIDINTLTSRSESFPYVLMEGARMSKPTVCSRVGGIPDFVMDGKTGCLFTSENSEELADKLISLLENPETAEKYGKALHDLALEKFSDTALAKKHIEIYNAVIRDYKDDKKYDCVLSGYYGFKNSGDDALLYAITESLKKYKPDIRICVLTADTNATKLQYGCDCYGRFNIFGVKKALKNTKMLLSGGGSLIQDATSSKSLTYYLYIMKLAKKCGAKLYVYANGIGPLKDKNLKRAAKALSIADMITLRESDSVSELERMGVSIVNTSVTADPALILEGNAEDAAEVMKKEGIPLSSTLFGISVREWQDNDGDFSRKVADIAEYASKKHGLTPVFIPMRYPHDVKISEEISDMTDCDSYVCRNNLSVKEILGLTSVCEAVFGMRLHTLVFAAGSAVPVVGIVYDKKVSGFLDYIGQNRSVEASDMDVEKAKTYIDEIMENKADISRRLSEKREELKLFAYKNAEIAVEMLGEQI